MTKKTYELVVGIVNGVGIIADAIVVFCVDAPLSAAIVASVGNRDNRRDRDLLEVHQGVEKVVLPEAFEVGPPTSF